MGVTTFVISISHPNRSRPAQPPNTKLLHCVGCIYARIWPVSPFHQALCCNWRTLWKEKTQTNWSDFHFVSLLWACPEWEIRSVIIQIKQQWETSNCSICVSPCRRDRSQSIWEKKPRSGGKMFCQIKMKELHEDCYDPEWKGSRLLKDIFICGQHFAQHDYCGHIWTL